MTIASTKKKKLPSVNDELNLILTNSSRYVISKKVINAKKIVGLPLCKTASSVDFVCQKHARE